MSARTSGATAGRPGPFRRLFQAQKSLKPVRCHRITVAGWTTEMASVQPAHRRDSRTQNRRSAVRSRGRGAVRWRTTSWCRNARFSSTRERWVRTPRRRPVRMRVIMPAIIDQAGRKSTLTRRAGPRRSLPPTPFTPSGSTIPRPGNSKIQAFASAWASVAVSVKARNRWRRPSRTVQTWTKATSTGTPPRRVVPTIRPIATTCSPPAMNSSGTK